MSPRRRFRAIVGLLALAIVLCTWMSLQRIEQDLLTRSQIALASANIPFYGVELDGRDVVLSGFVASAEQADRIRAIVGGLRGVRAVRDTTVLERIAGNPETDDSPALPLSPPRLRIQRLGDRVFVSGRFPDDGAAGALAGAVDERFGAARSDFGLITAPGVAHPDWLDAPQLLVELLALASDNVRLVIQGDLGVLSGAVSGPQAAGRLRDVAARIPGITWRFELYSPSGPVGAGGSA